VCVCASAIVNSCDLGINFTLADDAMQWNGFRNVISWSREMFDDNSESVAVQWTLSECVTPLKKSVVVGSTIERDEERIIIPGNLQSRSLRRNHPKNKTDCVHETKKNNNTERTMKYLLSVCKLKVTVGRWPGRESGRTSLAVLSLQKSCRKKRAALLSLSLRL
jgi:hypothetical protein